MSDLMTGLDALNAATPDLERAAQFYDGDAPEFFSSGRVAALLEEYGEHFRINIAKTAVDAVAKRCRVAAVTVPDNDGATTAIQEITRANDLSLHGHNFIRRAGEFGSAYAIVWPFDDGTSELDDVDGVDPADVALDSEQRDSGVEITYVSALHGRMMYDPEHPNRKSFFVWRWKQGDRFRVNLMYADRVERYITRAGTKGKAEEEWEEYESDTGGHLVDNPYGEIAAFHFRNDAPHGLPEHYHGYGLQEGVNKLFATLMSTVDGHGFPQRFGLLDPEAILDSNSDDPDWEDDADAPASADSDAMSRSSLRGGPGTITFLAGLKALHEFSAADPEVFLKPYRELTRAFAKVTETPEGEFDTADTRVSGESRRRADKPFADKVAQRRLWYGATWRELWRFALKVRGIELDPDQEIDVRWEPLDGVADDAESWEVVEKKIAAGVPVRQALLEAGYDPDSVDTWLDQQAEDMDLQRRVALLNVLAEAAQKLGTAVGLGVLSTEQAATIIARVVGQAAPEPEGGDDPSVRASLAALEAEATEKEKKAAEIAAQKPDPTQEGNGKPADQGADDAVRS